MFRYYMKNILRCPATYVAAVALFVSMLLSLEGYTLYDYKDALYMYQCAYAMGIAYHFLPVTAVIPLCFVACELQKNNAWHHALLRSSPWRYTLGGLLAALCSGAFVVLVSGGLFLLFSAIVSTEALSLKVSLFNGTEPFYAGRTGLDLLFIRISVIAANGVMYAGISYAVSNFTKNQYICAAAPFVLRTIVGYVTQALNLSLLDPTEVLLFGNKLLNPYGGLVYVGIYVLTVVCICALLFYVRLRRRLNYG